MTTDEIVKSLRACGRGCCDDCVCFQEQDFITTDESYDKIKRIIAYQRVERRRTNGTTDE